MAHQINCNLIHSWWGIVHSTHSTFTYMRCTAQVEARLNLEEGEDAFGALSLGEDVYGPFSGQVRSFHLAAIATKCSSVAVFI